MYIDRSSQDQQTIYESIMKYPVASWKSA